LAGQVEDVTPYDFAKIYNILPLWQAASPVDGTGQTIAIAGTSNIKLADVAAFRSAFGLPAKAPTVLITNHDPGTCPTFADSCSGDLIENTLDVEWSGAVAKGAGIVLVTSSAPTPTSDALYLSENYIVQHKTAPVMNVSYGECELVLGTAGNALYNNLWQAAAAEGIAVFVASGDAGSPACDQGFDTVDGVPYAAQFGLAVSGIASTPFNTAVGGTDLNWGSTAAPYWSTASSTTTKANALGYIPEVPWNNTCANPLTLPGLAADANYIGVAGVVDAESACNFALESGSYILTNFGVNLAGLLDTIGGGGGRSNCTTSDGGDPLSCSAGYAKPSWQTGAKGIPADGVRDIPDVSFFASDGFLGSAYLICVTGGGNACSYSSATEPVAQEVGGTSVASPAMAGVMALVNQKAGAAQGNPNVALYSLATKQVYSGCSTETVKATTASCVFNDIDTGTNAMPCLTGSPYCNTNDAGDPVGILSGFAAGAGYDPATGLGSINVANLVANWPSSTTAPLVSLTPASLTFTSTIVGQSVKMPVTVKNTGKTALSLSGTGLGIGISGTNASSFNQTNTCGSSLAAGASCTITVTFKPTVTGTLSASIILADNAFGSPQTVALSGTGAAPTPEATLSAQSLTFGATTVGTTNTAPAITLTNSGTGPLTIAKIAITGANASSFAETNTCGTSLAAQANCSITLVFKPAAKGTFTASLTVTDNASGSPQTLALSGTGK
jgi:subtilase family serine protease